LEIKMTGLTADQVHQLVNDETIQATVQANKKDAARWRDAELMSLGYNQALLETGNLPEGWTAKDMQDVINKQRNRLGI
jgi:hypothetical protein